jgi:hypothetical protein
MTRTSTATRSLAARSLSAKFTHKITHKSTYKIGLRPFRHLVSAKFKSADQVPPTHLSIYSSVPLEPTFAALIPRPIIPRPMEVSGLNHFNITASPALVEQLKSFYVNVIGLTVGPRALLDHDGFWLYAGELSIVHLSARQQSTCQQSIGRNTAETTTAKEVPLVEGCFNHISLSCVGLAAALEKMVAMEIPYTISEVLDFGQTQLFIQDPAGIGVELTFSNEKP